jgi:hypothetical protein
MPKGVTSFSEADKRAAIELWKAEEHLPYQTGAVKELDPEAVGHQDGRFRLPSEPGKVYTTENPGGDRMWWQHHPLLESC